MNCKSITYLPVQKKSDLILNSLHSDKNLSKLHYLWRDLIS